MLYLTFINCVLFISLTTSSDWVLSEFASESKSKNLKVKLVEAEKETKVESLNSTKNLPIQLCKCSYSKHWKSIFEEWKLSNRMVMLGSCSFHMGSPASVAIRGDREVPVRIVKIEKPFWIDKTEVTMKEFLRFFRETKYRTTAEELGSSFIFSPKHSKNADQGWWWIERGSVTWANDLPINIIQDEDEILSNVKSIPNPSQLLFPVTHVSWVDAMRFCWWRGQGSLPTETQWEFGCRGGLDKCLYPWGNILKPNGTHMTNIWQGRFPQKNTAEDGFAMTAPVASFPSNGFGLHGMVGNVWEWVLDSWNADSEEVKIQKGGSFMCHRNHCFRYRCGARTKGSWDSTSSNLGFRCIHRVYPGNV